MMKLWQYGRYGLLLVLGVGSGVAMWAGGAWMWVGFFVAIALALGGDAIFGDDLSEPSYGQTWILNAQLYANLPLLLWMTFGFAWQLSDRDVWHIGEQVMRWTGYDMVAVRGQNGWLDYLGGGLGLGLFYGVAGTNVGHELTHRTWSKSAQIVGRWLLAFTSDASFAIEHVYGHHRNVATREDAATARRGEVAWTFVVRSTVGSYLGAWRIERERLGKLGHSVWSWRNKMHRGNLMTFVYVASFWWVAGWRGALVFLAVSLYGKCWLELVNYMEHYGLVRVPGEPVEPRHSWNCNRRISGYLLYNLTRHSHHHAMGEKPFWELKAYPDTPMMPHGYLTMILIAMIPPLWNRMVIPRVLAWDARFASEAERGLIQEANMASGHTWFMEGLPEGMALPVIASDRLPEAANTNEDVALEEGERAPSGGGRIFDLFVRRRAHEVRVEGADVSFEVSHGETILAAALRSGIDFPHSCRVGGCAACKCKLKRGEVRALTDASYILSAEDLATGHVLACQSVPRGDVVVEVAEEIGFWGSGGPVIQRVGGRVQGLTRLTRDIMEVRLELDGPVAYRAGQYMELRVPGEVEEARSYSCATAIQEASGMTGELVFHVRRVEGGVMSGWVHERAKEGARVEVRGPFGRFGWKRAQANAPIVVMAGGSGMAPLLAMFEAAGEEERRREVLFFYGARSEEDLYELAVLEAIQMQWDASFTYVEVVEHASEGWFGERGLVTQSFARAMKEGRCGPQSGAQIYMCGPPGMIDEAERIAMEYGWEASHIHHDRFVVREDRGLVAGGDLPEQERLVV